MSEKVQTLRESLRELHDELEAVDSLDSESRELVGQLLLDLHALLDRAGTDESGADDHESLLDRLGDATRRFEADHPALARPIRRVVNALSDLGI